jgi:hypothetical protein
MEFGTIPEFLRWFDAVRAGTEPAARTPDSAVVSQAGHLDLTIGGDGIVRIQFTPVGGHNTDTPSAITLQNSSTTLQSFTCSDSPAGTILFEPSPLHVVLQLV